MASLLYTASKEDMLNGDINLDGATIKAMLVSSSYTETASETVLTTAAAQRIGTDQTLASKTVTNGAFDAADPTWTAVAGGSTIHGVVIYREVTNDSDSVPIAFIDLTNTATNGGDITVQWNASGIFSL